MGNRSQWLWPLVAWTVFAACALWLTDVGRVGAGISLDTDSAMRLAQVRDLLQGQGWFDTVQHRMNTPYGLPMHWSRLVDAPLALLMLVSERFAFVAWPLLLLAVALFLLGRIARGLGGDAAMVAVLALALLCTEIYGPFVPGNIDHHGLQLVLMLTALLGVMERRPHLAAAAVALGLGVGLESLPYALAAIAFFVADAFLVADKDGPRSFGLTLAGAALLLLLATTADPYRFTPVCDTYSLFYAVLLIAGGMGLAGISLLPRHRLAATAALGLGLLALAAALNPVCFAGPYAGLDAWMQTIFLAGVNEARPVWSFFRLAPSEVVGGYLYAAFALALSFFATPGRGRLVVIVFSAVALLVATFQFRGVNFALLFALPGLAAGMVRLTQRRSIVWLAAAILLGSGAAFTLAGALAEGQDKVVRRAMAFRAQKECGHETAMAVLRALPPGRVAGFVDQGPAILAYTKDSAIAGPYHRDAAGILDSYVIFFGQNPRTILRQRGIDYLMVCRAVPEWAFYRARGGLIAQLAAGHVPDWLVPAGKSGDVEVYRITR
ncbi:MAG TPA: hypothetical protein VJQ06_00105 [Rhizomicrobium sp.]|nr:hypothetical protein [Rhizomicrobium sp.]